MSGKPAGTIPLGLGLDRINIAGGSWVAKCDSTPTRRGYSTSVTRRRNNMRYALLWLLGVPIPVLILIWFMFHS